MRTFTQLSLQDKIGYASFVACLGNDILEWLHKAEKAFTTEEKRVLEEKAEEAFLIYMGATIEYWETQTKQEQISEEEN